MHPHFWTVPGIDFHIRTYGLCIVIGIIISLWISVRRAMRVGLDPATVTSMSVVGLILGVIGCRLMHVVHYYGDKLKTGEMGVKEVLQMGGGGEILGGVVLASLGAIGFLIIFRKPVFRYLDVVFPPMILAMGIGRIGCFMFGCCWGGICADEAGAKAIPWAVQFPYGSPPYQRHCQEELLEVPDDLMWVSPFEKDKGFQPIPRTVLSQCDIDGDQDLLDWAKTAVMFHRQKQENPDAKEFAELKAKLKEQSKTVETCTKPELNAAIHLVKLAGREESHVTTWKDLRALADEQKSLWVHPTQIYDAVALALMFVLLSAVFFRNGKPGMVVVWAMVLYPVNRVIQEYIRGDNPHDVFGFTISQFISATIFVTGIVLLIVLRKKPGTQLPSDSTVTDVPSK